MEIPRLAIGDLLELKKKHPCGCARVKILRLGSDVQLECTGCSHTMNIGRIKLEKAIRCILVSSHEEQNQEKGKDA